MLRERVKEFLAEYETSFGANFLIGLYVLSLLFFHFYQNIQRLDYDLKNLFIVLTSIISLISLHTLIEIVTQKSKVAYRFITIPIFLIYEFLYFWHFHMWSNFEYGLMAQNWSEMQNTESAKLIWTTTLDKLILIDYVNLIGFVYVLIYWGVYKGKLKPRQLNLRSVRVGLSVVALISIFNAPFFLYDELTFVLQSAYRYHFPAPSNYDFQTELANNPYPLFKDFKSQNNIEKKPNIILVAIESFNANFVQNKANNGLEYTPTFNSKISEGVFFENFYGHSMQTTRGHFGLVCGLPPIVTAKAMVISNGIIFQCLPKVLSEFGYQTYFIQGYHREDFDNTKNFMTNNGFEFFETTDQSQLTVEEREKYVWGFGIQDDFTFKQSFSTMDRLHAEKPETPIFTFIATISNHMDFRYVPKEQRYIYPEPKNMKEFYANSIRVTDEYLKTFFEELKKREYLQENTLIIITGDHSFPMGEHGHYLPESGSYLELFRTPMLMIWPNQLKPEIRKDYHSQQDVAPTLLDIVGYNGKVQFTGKSFYSNKESNFPIPLIQPYDGVHIGGIIDGIKLMTQKRTSRHMMFDLNLDPDEKHNIYSKKHTLLPAFKQLEKQIYMNEYLIRNNRVVPTTEPSEIK